MVQNFTPAAAMMPTGRSNLPALMLQTVLRCGRSRRPMQSPSLRVTRIRHWNCTSLPRGGGALSPPLDPRDLRNVPDREGANACRSIAEFLLQALQWLPSCRFPNYRHSPRRHRLQQWAARFFLSMGGVSQSMKRPMTNFGSGSEPDGEPLGDDLVNLAASAACSRR